MDLIVKSKPFFLTHTLHFTRFPIKFNHFIFYSIMVYTFSENNILNWKINVEDFSIVNFMEMEGRLQGNHPVNTPDYHNGKSLIPYSQSNLSKLSAQDSSRDSIILQANPTPPRFIFISSKYF
ncbi:hypothetical protein ACJX0J_018319 [Zea mays]